MGQMSLVRMTGLIAAIALPFCNVPLLVRIARRKSSGDISVAWAIGVFVCLVAMLPAGLASPDVVFKAYTVVNVLLFSVVVVQVIRYR